MNLAFKRPHKSIRELPHTELNNFTVLTGTNGAGKSHLLEAIEKGHIVVDDLPRSEGVIRRFDWDSFVATIKDSDSPDQLHKKREKAVAQLLKVQESTKQKMLAFFVNNNISGHKGISDVHFLANVTQAELLAVLDECIQNGAAIPSSRVLHLASLFVSTRNSLVLTFSKTVSQYGNLRAILERAAVQLNVSALEVPEKELRASFPLTWNASNALQLEYAEWFSAWHTAWQFNRINRFYGSEDGDITKSYVSDSEFRKLYGDEPWIISNKVLKAAGLRHQFNNPTSKLGDLDQPFLLRLIDPEDNTQITTSELSSGERILLAVTLMLHQSDGASNLVELPKLLLLDEVDAPLHPSYTKMLIEILEAQFVKRFNVGVILTTHSPSTVALSPKGCVYELVRRPREIRSVSSSDATQLLSSGFVSVASGDVIVITESSDDVEYYQQVHGALSRKGNLINKSPLRFIAASKNGNDGLGGGCPQVCNWAPKLHELGIHRFRGLIDLDGSNIPDKVVSVIKRDSMENYLFDPLCLTAFLFHRSIFENLGVETSMLLNVTDFMDSTPEVVNTLVKKFCSWIAIESNIDQMVASESVICKYVGFSSVEVPSWWLTTDGHDLKAAVRGPLNKLGQKLGRGALIKDDHDELIKFQTVAHTQLLSEDFISIFEDLSFVNPETSDDKES
jgi:energy-coupling factor transporter ATP-binding protein EcfA2